MSTPLDGPTQFNARLKFYIANAAVTPKGGASFPPTVQRTMVEIVPGSGVIVGSASVTVGNAFMGSSPQGPTEWRPVEVNVRYTSTKRFTDAEIVRSFARALYQSFNVTRNGTDLWETVLGRGSYIVDTLSAPSMTRPAVRVEAATNIPVAGISPTTPVNAPSSSTTTPTGATTTTIPTPQGTVRITTTPNAAGASSTSATITAPNGTVTPIPVPQATTTVDPATRTTTTVAAARLPSGDMVRSTTTSNPSSRTASSTSQILPKAAWDSNPEGTVPKKNYTPYYVAGGVAAGAGLLWWLSKQKRRRVSLGTIHIRRHY